MQTSMHADILIMRQFQDKLLYDISSMWKLKNTPIYSVTSLSVSKLTNIIRPTRMWIFELADWEWRHSQVRALSSFYMLLTPFFATWKIVEINLMTLIF